SIHTLRMLPTMFTLVHDAAKRPRCRASNLLRCHCGPTKLSQGSPGARGPRLSARARGGGQGSPPGARLDAGAAVAAGRVASAVDLERRDRPAQPELREPAPLGERAGSDDLGRSE